MDCGHHYCKEKLIERYKGLKKVHDIDCIDRWFLVVFLF